MSKVTMINTDAKVNLTFGSGFIQKLQQLTLWIATNKSEEELENFKKLVESNSPLEEDWMNHLHTMSILINEVERVATESGQTYEQDAQDLNIPDN